MLHISFALYLAALLSGVMLLSAFASDPKYRRAPGFRAFIAQYLMITVFVLVTAVFLYLSVNLSPNEVFGRRLFTAYFVAILLFLGFLPVAIRNYNASLLPSAPPAWFDWLLRFVALYSVVGSIAVWWPRYSWYLPIVGGSIALFVAVLIILSWQARRHYHDVFNGPTARRVSRVMIAQSLALPAAEVLFWSEHLSRDGFTFSLPVLCLVNNMLLWVYRDALMPGAGQPLALMDTESLLSPKEREVALALAQGLSNKQIAAKLGISQSTVKNHIYSIFRKCNVTNRVALVRILHDADR